MSEKESSQMDPKELDRLKAKFDEDLPGRDTWDPEHILFKLGDFPDVKDGDTILTGTIIQSPSEDTGSILTSNGVFCHKKFEGYEGRVKIIKEGNGFIVKEAQNKLFIF